MTRRLVILLLAGLSATMVMAHRRHTSPDPMRSQRFYLLGDTHTREGLYIDAYDCYTRAIELDPSCAPCYARRGDLCMTLAYYPLAVDDYAEALRLESYNADYRVEYARALLSSGQLDEAAAQLRQVLADDPGMLEAKRLLATYHYLQDEVPLYIDLYLAYLQEYYELHHEPSSFDHLLYSLQDSAAYLYLSRALTSRISHTDGDIQVMFRFIRASIRTLHRDYADAIADLSLLIQNFQDYDHSALRMRAYCYMQTEQYPLALIDYNCLIPLLPRDTQAYHYRSLAHRYLGHIDEAIADLISLTRLDYRLAPDAFYQAARLEVLRERYTPAIRYLSRAIELAPDLAYLYRYRAEQYEALGNSRMASLDYHAADLLTASPDDSLPILPLGYDAPSNAEAVRLTIDALTRRYLSNRTIGDADILFMVGAIDYPFVYRALSDEITRYDAAEQYELRDLFYLLRASLLHQRGHTADALADLDSVSIFSFPREVEPVIEQQRIHCLSQLRRWPEVIDRTTPLIALRPDSSPCYVIRAEAYYALEQYPAAEADLRRAFSIDSSAHTAYLFATLCQRLCRHTEAVRYLTHTILHADTLYPHLTRAYLLRGESYLRCRDTLAAYADFHEVLRRDTTYRNTLRHYALYRLGHHDEALRWVRQLIREYPLPDNYYDAACLYALEADTTQTLRYLEIALRWGYSEPRMLLHDPNLDPIRSHPDFQALIERYVPSLKPKKQTKNQKKH